MKVLVSGGTGFIGKHLLPLLTARGHQVMVIGRRSSAELEENKVQFVEADLTCLSAEAETAIRKFLPEACIHLFWQGIPDYSFENCRRNFDASLHLFRLLMEIKCRKVLAAGSCWEYGELRGAVKEGDEARELSVFAAFKTSSRLILESLCRQNGATAIWARIFFVYGPGQRPDALIPSTIRNVFAQNSVDIRNPNAQNDFVYVGDVARAFLALLEEPRASGIYNIGRGQGTRVGELVKKIFETLQSKLPYSYVAESRPQDSFWADSSKLEQATGWRAEIDPLRGIELSCEQWRKRNGEQTRG